MERYFILAKIYKSLLLVVYMAKRGSGLGVVLADIWAFVAWVTGVIVSLAVGFGLANDILRVPYIPVIITEIAGWIVIVLSLLGLLLAIIDRFNR